MSTPPPLPPRPSPAALSSFDARGQVMASTQFMSGFQPFLGMTPGYGMFDSYNRMSGFNGENFSGYNSSEGNFIRLAEESSRNAFQSIESVVSAVTSVANMLNSTHVAVFSSFRAVIGVVEQIRSMKQQTSYAILTLVHCLRILWRRVLCWLRLRPRNYANSEMVWANLVSGIPEYTGLSTNGPVLSWPTLFFWTIAIGGPYLIYRCVSNMVKAAEDSRKWASGDAEHYTAQALYNFNASNSQELSFNAYDMIRVAPKDQQPKVRDWILASTVDGERIGLVPMNYIKLINRNLSKSPPQSSSNIAAVANRTPSSQRDLFSSKTQKLSNMSELENAFSLAQQSHLQKSI